MLSNGVKQLTAPREEKSNLQMPVQLTMDVSQSISEYMLLNKAMMGVPQKKHSQGQTINSKCKKVPSWHIIHLTCFVSRGFLCPICQACFKSHGWVSLSTAQQYEEHLRVVSRQTAGNGVCMASSMSNVVKFSKLQN